MYSNILVPLALDSDEAAAASLEIANALKAEGGSVTLLHVIEDIPAYVAGHFPEGLSARSRAYANAGLDKVLAVAGAEAKTKLMSGHAARSILDEADDTGADCIVMSSHRPGLQDYFIGSTAAHVVRHARCAVHVIR